MGNSASSKGKIYFFNNSVFFSLSQLHLEGALSLFFWESPVIGATWDMTKSTSPFLSQGAHFLFKEKFAYMTVLN